jgi:hypothetical protein
MRAIETAGLKATPPQDTGTVPDLRWLPIADLVIDDSYQRDIQSRQSRSHIERIASKFDWRLFSCVVVSPVPGGKFAIIDGQHRTHAAALIGEETVPCQIVQATRGMQAAAFASINGNKIGVSHAQRYRAALAFEDPAALRIKRLTEAAGIKLLTYNPSAATMKPSDTLAHQAIRQIASSCSDETAIIILSAVRAMAQDVPRMMTSDLFVATSTLLKPIPRLTELSPIVLFGQVHARDVLVLSVRLMAKDSSLRGVAALVEALRRQHALQPLLLTDDARKTQVVAMPTAVKPVPPPLQISPQRAAIDAAKRAVPASLDRL